MRLRTVFVVTVIFALQGGEAYADLDPFEFQIYPYETTGKGKLDPQLLSSFVAAGHRIGGTGTSQDSTLASQSMTRLAAEFEYGLTDKVDFAYYANVAIPMSPGMAPQYAGSKFRLHGKFFEKGFLPVDLGWYAEVEWWNKRFEDDTAEGELMLIAQKEIGRWTVILNFPDLDKAFVGADASQGFQLGYRGEVRYWVSKALTMGLQGYGAPGLLDNLSASLPMAEQQHYVMPVAHFVMPGNMPASLGVGFGLTHGSDPVLFKFNLYFGGAGVAARDPRMWR